MKYSSKFDETASICGITADVLWNGSVRSCHNAKGFTLIEIMVVMILIAISGSLVLTNVGQSGRMKESRMFASQIVSMCKKARLTAINNGIPACLTIEPKSRECRVGLMDDLMSEFYNAQGKNDEDKELRDSGDRGQPDDPYRQLSGMSATNSNLKIPENILLEGEYIKVDSNGVYFICFYPDGSSGGGILTVSVENEFQFTFQVDMLTGSIRELE